MKGVLVLTYHKVKKEFRRLALMAATVRLVLSGYSMLV